MNSAASQQLNGIPQTSIIQVQTAQSQLIDTLEKYKTRIVKLAVAEIVIGVIIIILSLVFLLDALINGGSQGVWCGPFLIISGIRGFVTRSRPPHRMFITNIITSLLAALFMVLLVRYSRINVSSLANYHSEYSTFGFEIAIESIIAALGLIAFIITVLHVGYSCAGACTVSAQMMPSAQINDSQLTLAANQAALNSGNGLNTGLTQSDEWARAQQGGNVDVPPPYSPDP